MSVTIESLWKFEGAGTTLLNNLLGYWKFDESSGTLYDSVGSNNATGSGIVYSADGKISRCVQYDTNTDWVVVNNDSSLYPNGDEATVSLWFKLNTVPTTTNTLFVYRVSGTPYYSINAYITTSSGYVRFIVYNSSDVQIAAEGSNTQVDTGVWYHFVGVCRGDGQTSRVYLNNSDVTVWTSGSFSGVLKTPTSDLYIGQSNSGSSNAPDGYIDEVGYWNRALTTDEISALWNSGNGLTHPFS